MIYGRNPIDEKKQDLNYILILNIMFAALVISIMMINGSMVWGSETDWLNQHFTIPEYFRTRFYDTGDLFPDFALQLGGGQNIYNFAYYGLMNPLYLPAYLMPWVTMAEYIQVISLISVDVSCIMCYYLMKKHFSSRMSFLLSIMFMCCAPLIFHSHRHIMFVNYFPFLFAVLLAVSERDRVKNRTIIILSSYCILCSSFYYSISAFAVIIIYSAFIFLRSDSKLSFSKLIEKMIPKIGCLFLGGLLAGILWLPTFATLISGREKSSSIVNVLKLLIPTINLQYLLYSPYSLGANFIAVAAVIVMLKYGDKASKLLSIIFVGLVCCPIIIYVCNGTMYIDSKVLIPFFPLLIILCGEFFEMLFLRKVNVITTVIMLAVITAVSVIFNACEVKLNLVLILNAAIVAVSILIFSKIRKRSIVLIPTAVFSVMSCLVVNSFDTFVSEEKLESVYSEDVQELVDKITASDNSFYRFANNANAGPTVNAVYGANYCTPNIYSSVTNTDYRNFRFNELSSENSCRNNAIQIQPNNVIFDVMMSCKYRISKSSSLMLGEKFEDKDGEYYLFSNENALPVGYASSSILSEESYSKLGYAEKAEALLENIVVPEGSSLPSIPNNTQRLDTAYSVTGDTSKIKLVNGAYEVDSTENFSLTVNLSEPINDKLIMLKLHADNRIGDKSERNDVWISVSGVKNKLSSPDWKYNNKNYDFTYALSSTEPVESLVFEFSKGNYIVSDFEAYTLDSSVIENASENKDEFIINHDESNGDLISGKISVTNNGWFNLSIPYDKGFEIYVDGIKTKYFKTNTAFIGFPIESGEHSISIKYTAPLRTAGIIMTVIGFGASAYMLASMWASQRRRILSRRRITVTGRRSYGGTYYSNSAK